MEMIFCPLRVLFSWYEPWKFNHFLGVPFDQWISLSPDEITRMLKFQTAKKRLFRKPIYKLDNWGGLYLEDHGVLLITANIFDGVPSSTQQVILLHRKGWVTYTLFRQGMHQEITGHPMIDLKAVADWIRSEDGKRTLFGADVTGIHMGFLHTFADGIQSQEEFLSSADLSTSIEETSEPIFF